VARNGLESVDWPEVATSLVDPGWCRLAGAIGAELAPALIDAAPEPWLPLPEEEGTAGVRQAGSSSYVPLAEADATVQDLARDLTASLNDALPAGAASVPAFNEVQWTRYPADVGHITSHRDPWGCGGVIAIATLAGQAAFHIGGRGLPIAGEWETAPGDVVVLRGNGWPTDDARCPMHGAGPPRGQERIIMTFRHNLGGAGSAYFS
jgi:hypothetical protein